MEHGKIVSNMNSYLHTAAVTLASWLGDILPRTSDEWWGDSVMANLSTSQYEIAQKKRISTLEEFDLAALLRIADKSWYVMRGVEYLPSKEREVVRDMMRVRNNWAHCSTTLPGKDAIIEDLNTLHEFLGQVKGPEDVRTNIDEMIDAVKYNRVPIHEEPIKTPVDDPISSVDDGEIKEKSQVYLVGNPDKKGIVIGITDLGMMKKYQVFVDGELREFYTGQIAPVEAKSNINWIDINEFKSYLTASQINNPAGRDLYSVNSARIDFVPYQFRPALKLIQSDEPRILIADSVGVGKTIEAGLIIKELQARNELVNVLIICPKPLVTERKWEMEMKRFDEEFVPVNGSELRQIISDTDRDGEWPIRYNKMIVPYSILDGRTYEGDPNKKGSMFGLKDLDPAPHFDLVIVDEAHHIRNGSMEKEKAFEYKCVKYFCDHADAVVMLTATPLQTSDDDLYTLLNLLRPDVVIDKETFNLMARPNVYISNASRIMRSADEGWQEEALSELMDVVTTQWGDLVIATNPIYKRVINTLRQPEITREERVQLISDTEKLHSFNSMLNRTRRKDIQDFCIRRPMTVSVEFTPEQAELHNEILRFEHEALLKIHGNPRSIPFMMSTIKRQAASCIFGLAPHVQHLIDRRFDQIEEYDDDFEVSQGDIYLLKDSAERLISLAESLPEDDPKFDAMMTVVHEKQTQENNKIILFSTFRFTLKYLREKLIGEGIRVEQVDGSVKDEIRQDYRRRFELPKDDSEAIDMLLFTEVGSEGLDYQFCDTMINYDLPWNPMRIEQRIGRIDRRGQKSDAVGIYNVITNGTVDADIYFRCLMRIGVFEASIGECEGILGEISDSIEKIALDYTLTEEERRRKLEQIADNEVRKVQELNKLEEAEKDLFGFNLSEYTTSKEIQEAENQWVTPRSIQCLVEQYLKQRVGDGQYIKGEGEVKNLNLSFDGRSKLRDDLNELAPGKNAARKAWELYLKGRLPNHKITFDPEAAEKSRDAFFITPMHPLAKQAAEQIASGGKSYIRLEYPSDEIVAGRYKFSVYSWKYTGVNPHFRLKIVCDNSKLEKELSEIISSLQSNNAPISINEKDWDVIEGRQIALWVEEKAEEMSKADVAARYKIESITNSYNNRKRSLETKIADAVDANIIRMYTGELEAATESYRTKLQYINDQKMQTDIHSTLIANGIIDIYN